MAKATEVKSDSKTVATTGDASGELLHVDAKRLDVDFSQIKTYEDAMSALVAEFGEITDVSEYGDGFVLLENKDALIGRPLLILDCTFVDKDIARGKKGNYVAMKVLDIKAGVKYAFADGGTGIYPQMMNLVKVTKRRGGFGVPNGLRKSEYTYTDDDGDESPACTYYLDESPAS